MSVAAHSDRFAALKVGDTLPERDFECGNVQLMLYNAALWNGHRIHFDEPYAKNVEGYPGLVLASNKTTSFTNSFVPIKCAKVPPI